jgi:hypothetical protein
MLRLLMVVGLGLVLAGGVSTAAVLLPEVIDDPLARIWVAIGLFGVVVAGMAAIGAYALSAVGVERVMRWLRSSSRSDEQASTDPPKGQSFPI